MKALFRVSFLTALLAQGPNLVFGMESGADTVEEKSNSATKSTSPSVPNDRSTSNSKAITLDALLKSEAEGQAGDRSKLLLVPDAGKTPAAPFEKAIRWQAGEIEIDGRWHKLSELDESRVPETLKRYQTERGTAPLDREGHRRMAKWCLSEKLAPQEQAHWFGVLETAPDDAEARRSLGFAAIDGRWFSNDELKSTKSKAQETLKALKSWLPKIRDLVAAIEGSDTKKRLKAIQQLKTLKDPKAIPTLRFAIERCEPNTALHLLNALKRFQTKEACRALMTIAITTPTTELGQDAAVALSRFPKEMFVPALLDYMSTEKDLRRQLVTQPNGDLVLQLMEVRELKQHVETAQLDKVLKVNNALGLPMAFANRIGGRLNGGRVSLVESTITAASENQVAAEVSRNEAERDAVAQKARLDKENEATRQVQSNVATVLRIATGLKLDDDPRGWWNWWDLEQEILAAGNKEILRTYGQDFQSLVYSVDPQTSRIFQVSGSVEDDANPIPSEPSSSGPRRNLTRPILQRVNPSARIDCLTAGTLIQTESGLRPIETIQIGDRIVSQNIETAEISLKPVLRISQRPISITCNIVLTNHEKFQSTLGHYWWVVGKGWIKTKDLLAGMHIRTATGSTEISRLEAAPDAVTFNLSVADHHTYFVGQDRLLSFDSREIIPTLQRAPGLAATSLFAP